MARYKGIDKFYYKIWKHLNKKFCEKNLSSAQSNPSVPLEQRILNELVALRKYIILKDICPEIINEISPKISFPEGELGNENFLKYFRYLDENKTPSAYSFLWHWLSDIAVDINNTKIKYQSSSFSADEYRKNIAHYAQDDCPACIKNNVGYLSNILCYGDPFQDGDEFCNDVIGSKNFANYTPLGYMWLCNFFLIKNKQEYAKKCFDMYVKKVGTKGINEWLAVADFAYQNGMKQFSLESAVFNEIIKSTVEDLLSKRLKNRTVALVGNGPQERGKNLKDIIDAHDIVIRMNTYDLNPDYVKDYGKKCNIWYQYTGLSDQEWKKEKDNPDFYFIGNSPYSSLYPKHLVNMYANELSKGTKIQAVKLSEISELHKKSGLYCPSGGLLMIYLIKKANSEFSIDDCFGFSFKENKENLSWKHAQGEGYFMPHHSLELERPVIYNILSEGK